MATKRFKSTTGYPVTVGFRDPSGNNIEVRVGVDEPYETDDKSVIEALKGSPEVEEAKESRSEDTNRKGDKDNKDAS